MASETCIACGQPIEARTDGPMFLGWRHIMPKHDAVPNPKPFPDLIQSEEA